MPSEVNQSVSIRVGVDGTEDVERLSSAINAISESSNDTTRSSRESASAIGELASSSSEAAEDVGGMGEASEAAAGGVAGLAVAVAAAVGGAILAAIDIFREFDASITEVAAVSGASKDELLALTAAAKNVGETTKYSATEAAGALGNLAAAGLSVEESVTALTSVTTLASAGNVSLNESSEILIATMGQFGLAVEEAAHISDILVAAANDGVTSVAQMGQSFKFAGTSAKAVGLTLEETSAIISSMSNYGIKGSEAGVALRGAISGLAHPAKEAGETLERLGVQITNLDGSSRNYNDIMKDLGKTTYTTGDIITIFGTEAMPGVLAQLSTGADAINKMADSYKVLNGTAKEASDIMSTSIDQSLTRLTSLIKNIAIDIGDKMKPIIISSIDAVSSAVSSLRSSAGSTIDAMKVISSVVSDSFGPALSAVFDLLKVLPGSISVINLLFYEQGSIVDKLSDKYRNFFEKIPLVRTAYSSLVDVTSHMIESVAIWIEMEGKKNAKLEDGTKVIRSVRDETGLLLKSQEDIQKAISNGIIVQDEANGTYKLTEKGLLDQVIAVKKTSQSYIDLEGSTRNLATYQAELQKWTSIATKDGYENAEANKMVQLWTDAVSKSQQVQQQSLEKISEQLGIVVPSHEKFNEILELGVVSLDMSTKSYILNSKAVSDGRNSISRFAEGIGVEVLPAMSRYEKVIHNSSEWMKMVAEQTAGYALKNQEAATATKDLSEATGVLNIKIDNNSANLKSAGERVAVMSEATRTLVKNASDASVATGEFGQSVAAMVTEMAKKGSDGLSNLSAMIEYLDKTSTKSSGEIRIALQDAFSSLPIDVMKNFQAIVESSNLSAKTLAITSEAMLGASLKKLGLDVDELRTGFDSTGRSAIQSFEMIASNSGTTSDMISESFKKALDISDSIEELSRLRTSIVSFGDDGVISSNNVSDALAQIDARLRTIASTLDGETADAFKRMGVQSKGELEALATQAEEDFNRIASSGEVTAEGLNEAANKYINATRAAYGDGATEMAKYAAESKGAHVAIENTAQSVERLGEAGDGASTSMEKVAVSTGEAVEKTKEVASDISKADKAATDFEETMGAIAAAIDSVTKANRDWMSSLSDKAVNAYVDQLGWGFKNVTQDLKFFRQAEKDALEVIDNIQMDNLLQMYNAVDQVMDRVNITANRVAAEFYHQSASAEVLKEKLADVGNVSNSAANSAESAISSFDLLDDQTLDSLRSQIEAVRQANEALSESIHGTLSGFEEELLRLQGNQQAVEEKNYQERLSQLDDYYQKAKAIRDNDAMAEVERARKTAEEIHALNLAKIKEDQEANKSKNQGDDPYQTNKIREATQAQIDYSVSIKNTVDAHKEASEQIVSYSSQTEQSAQSTLTMTREITSAMNELTETMRETSAEIVRALQEVERAMTG